MFENGHDSEACPFCGSHFPVIDLVLHVEDCQAAQQQVIDVDASPAKAPPSRHLPPVPTNESLKLTTGATKRIFCEPSSSTEPAVLQVLSIQSEQGGRYRSVLSDGSFSFNCVFSADAFEQSLFSNRDRKLEGLPERFSIVKVTEFFCANNPGQKDTRIVILGIKLVASGSTLIGAVPLNMMMVVQETQIKECIAHKYDLNDASMTRRKLRDIVQKDTGLNFSDSKASKQFFKSMLQEVMSAKISQDRAQKPKPAPPVHMSPGDLKVLAPVTVSAEQAIRSRVSAAEASGDMIVIDDDDVDVDVQPVLQDAQQMQQQVQQQTRHQTQPLASGSASSPPSQPPPPFIPCPYGDRCYRSNPSHLRDCHPPGHVAALISDALLSSVFTKTSRGRQAQGKKPQLAKEVQRRGPPSFLDTGRSGSYDLFQIAVPQSSPWADPRAGADPLAFVGGPEGGDDDEDDDDLGVLAMAREAHRIRDKTQGGGKQQSRRAVLLQKLAQNKKKLGGNSGHGATPAVTPSPSGGGASSSHSLFTRSPQWRDHPRGNMATRWNEVGEILRKKRSAKRSPLARGGGRGRGSSSSSSGSSSGGSESESDSDSDGEMHTLHTLSKRPSGSRQKRQKRQKKQSDFKVRRQEERQQLQEDRRRARQREKEETDKLMEALQRSKKTAAAAVASKVGAVGKQRGSPAAGSPLGRAAGSPRMVTLSDDDNGGDGDGDDDGVDGEEVAAAEALAERLASLGGCSHGVPTIARAKSTNIKHGGKWYLACKHSKPGSTSKCKFFKFLDEKEAKQCESLRRYDVLVCLYFWVQKSCAYSAYLFMQCLLVHSAYLFMQCLLVHSAYLFMQCLLVHAVLTCSCSAYLFMQCLLVHAVFGRALFRNPSAQTSRSTARRLFSLLDLL
jgi:hypothetical protein